MTSICCFHSLDCGNISTSLSSLIVNKESLGLAGQRKQFEDDKLGSRDIVKRFFFLFGQQLKKIIKRQIRNEKNCSWQWQCFILFCLLQ